MQGGRRETSFLGQSNRLKHPTPTAPPLPPQPQARCSTLLATDSYIRCSYSYIPPFLYSFSFVFLGEREVGGGKESSE